MRERSFGYLIVQARYFHNEHRAIDGCCVLLEVLAASAQKEGYPSTLSSIPPGPSDALGFSLRKSGIQGDILMIALHRASIIVWLPGLYARGNSQPEHDGSRDADRGDGLVRIRSG